MFADMVVTKELAHTFYGNAWNAMSEKGKERAIIKLLPETRRLQKERPVVFKTILRLGLAGRQASDLMAAQSRTKGKP